jgi:hypothetical protein
MVETDYQNKNTYWPKYFGMTVSPAIAEEGEALLARFASKEISSDGRFFYTIKKNLTQTEAGRLDKAIDDFVFKKVKAEQGSRPSDFDVQAMMSIVKGGIFSNPEEAAMLLDQALKSGKLVAEARAKMASSNLDKLLGRKSEMSPEMAEAVEKAKAREVATEKAKSKVSTLITAAKKAGMTRKQLQDQLALETGAILSDEDFDAYDKGFK